MVKIEDLKRINMLKSIPTPLLETIGKQAQLSIFGAQTRLFSVGEDLDTFYMLIMGQVSLTISLGKDVDVILDNLQSGRSFGSSALLADSTASYTAVCQEPCEVITLNGPRMIALFEDNPELAYHMMTGVARQYKETLDLRARMTLKTLAQHPELTPEEIDPLTPAF
jgi:CRP-like cAMP-binding protein